MPGSNNLSAAIATAAAYLHLQPLCRAQNGRVAGYELLYRSNDAQHGDTQALILRLEQQNEIVDFDRFILRSGMEIATKIAGFLSPQAEPLALNINLSGHSLSQPSFRHGIAGIGATLPAHGIRLAVEVTETAPGRDAVTFALNIAALRKAGFGIVLDDFPKGHNSLNRFLAHEGHVDGIKLDKSVLKQALAKNDFTELRHLAALAHERGKFVVAEGVSSPELLRRLCAHGVDFGQGYGLGRPLPAADVLQAMRLVQENDGSVKPTPPPDAAIRPVALAATAAVQPGKRV